MISQEAQSSNNAKQAPMTHRYASQQPPNTTVTSNFFQSRMPMSLTKKNEEILRVYREANQHMFKLAGFTNKSLNDIQNIVLNPRLRKS